MTLLTVRLRYTLRNNHQTYHGAPTPHASMEAMVMNVVKTLATTNVEAPNENAGSAPLELPELPVCEGAAEPEPLRDDAPEACAPLEPVAWADAAVREGNTAVSVAAALKSCWEE